MPIRKRKTQAPEQPRKRTRKKDPSKVLGGKLYDEYYYFLLHFANVRDDYEPTKEHLTELGLPFEWSRSPSGSAAFRIHKKHKNHPGLQPDKEKKTDNKCPVFIPYVAYGKETKWQMQEYNSFPYLFKDWTPIVIKKKRIRKKTHDEEDTNTTRPEPNRHERVRKRVRRRRS